MCIRAAETRVIGVASLHPKYLADILYSCLNHLSDHISGLMPHFPTEPSTFNFNIFNNITLLTKVGIIQYNKRPGIVNTLYFKTSDSSSYIWVDGFFSFRSAPTRFYIHVGLYSPLSYSGLNPGSTGSKLYGSVSIKDFYNLF